MENRKFGSFAEMLTVLNTEEICRKYLEELRWRGVPICPHCGVQNKGHYKLKMNGNFKGQYKCKDCRDRFTVTVGTAFHGSHISLRKWFIAIYIFGSHKKGISSHQLARDLAITQKSAWFMLMRMREMIKDKVLPVLSNIVELDETFVGGKNKNRHYNKKYAYQRGTGRDQKDKTPVFGLLEKGGKVIAKVVPNTKSGTLLPIIQSVVSKGSIVVTDDYVSYLKLPELNYRHESVKHLAPGYRKAEEHSRVPKFYISESGLNTQGIENFWSILKRGILGIYHKTTRKHLQRYCDEFTSRFNTRLMEDSERFAFCLINNGERLTYKALIGKV